VAVVLLVVARLLVVAACLLGPWTDEGQDLRGWDATRFQEIVEHPGTPYVDHEVEYPPGALAVLELVAGPDVVRTQDRLVVLMFAADLGVAGVLAWRWGRSAALAWLVLGLALLPGSYLRFDLLSVLLGVGGVALAGRGRARLGGLSLAAAVLVKTWPVVVLPSLLRADRHRALVWALGTGAAVGLLWVGWVGVDGPAQVVGFRGATGWHAESTPGLIAGLIGGDEAHLESGAFRLGRADGRLSLVLALGLLAGLALLWRRALRAPTPDAIDRDDALAAAGSVALLLVTAPLLSPQYLVWLLPWAAIAWACRERMLSLLAAAATLLTAAVLATFGPPGVDEVPAQLLLLVRNGLLLAVAVVAFRRLSPPRDPRRHRGRRRAPAGRPPRRWSRSATDRQPSSVPATGAPAVPSAGS